MKRDLLLLTVALIALAGSVVAAWGTADQRDQNLRGYTNAALDTALPYVVARLGVNADLTRYEGDALFAQLERMAQAGMVWVRQFFAISRADDGAFVLDYAKHDPLLDVLRARPEINLIAVLDIVPGGDIDPTAFATAAAEFAARYRDTIDVYQIDDEPNLIEAWGGEPRPAEYAALLRAAYDAIHSADADAEVLAAALAPTLEQGPNNLSDLRYLDALYHLGLAEFSDGVAAKPFGFNAPHDAPPDAEQLNFNRLVLLREIMLEHGDGESPLWASEWGWNSLPDGWQGAQSIWGQVSAEAQTAYTVGALELASRYPWLAGMTLTNWQHLGAADDPRWGFSLVAPDGTPTPRLDALAAWSAAQPAAAGLGLHHPRSQYAGYSGVWTLSEQGADIGWIGDSTLEFRFAGDSISLLTRQGDYTAYLYAEVDGQPANALPRDAGGNAYLVLTSDTLQPQTQLVPLARGLGGGTHTLRIVADRGWDRWALAGFAVGGDDLRAPYDRQIALALVSAAVSGIAAVLFARRVDWGLLTRPLHALLDRLGDVGRLALAGTAAILLMIGMLLTWRDAAPEFFRREPVQLGLAILTAGLLYVNPALIVSIIAAGVLFVLFYHRPLHGLTLTLFSAPFFLFPVELYRFAFPLSEVLVLLTAAAWALRTAVTWAERRNAPAAHTAPPIKLHLLDLLIAAYLLLGVVAMLTSSYRGEAITELRVLFIEPCLFYAVLRFSRPTRDDLLRLVDALILSGALVALIGLFLYARGDAIITAEEGARRLASVYGSPNNVGLWLGRCIPFALAFALAPLDRPRRLAAAAALVLFAPTLALTQSAGALFIGVPAAVAAVLLAGLGRRALLPLLALAAAGAAALPFLLQSARFARLLDLTDGTNFFRIRVWQSALAALRDHPLTGLGLDQFLYYFRGRYIYPDAWQEPNLSHPHNAVLDFWVRLGLLGLLLGITLHVVLFRLLLQALRRLRGVDALGWALALGALGALVNQLAHGMVDNSIFVSDLIYVFMLLCGLALALADWPVLTDKQPD